MTNTVKRSIPMAAALAAALLLGGAAHAQGANGSVTEETNANAATSNNSSTMGSKPAAGAMSQKGTAATTMSNGTTMGSKPAMGGTPGAKAPKGEGADAMIGDSKSPGSVQPGEAMAKPKMTAQERADRKAARKASKMSKDASANDAMLKDSNAMPAKP